MLLFLIPSITTFNLLFTNHIDLAVYANYLRDIQIGIHFLYVNIHFFLTQALASKCNPTSSFF
ncbi:hypothetical protein IK1_04556 [Bacillus cereus VD146]|uniref:Uncharacterized protein n=2 Tax=Bacillus cereus TaxID=1396 RepID=R8NFK5_BACCX|nr:hypothetical protein IG3_06292 [Bacillus cereus HuA2-1]EOP44823.1 hypothetical protein IK1_04556 [Bacillus cereus VD146]